MLRIHVLCLVLLCAAPAAASGQLAPTETAGSVAQQAYIKASNTDVGDVFGTSVAVSDDTAVIGACYEGSGATGVGGDQGDNSVSWAGAAYVFVRNGAGWSQQAYLKASNTDASDLFGIAVALDGDTAVIGAIYESSGATGVDGDQADNSAPEAGAVYVFVRDGTSWSQQAYLKPSNTDAGDSFGWPVAISGDTVVVGTAYEDSAATGVDGDAEDDSAADAGAVYVFVRDGTTWSQQAYLKASNTESMDGFGESVSISGDTVVVGANGEDSKATGIDGDQTDNSLQDSGAAYVFVRSGTTWSQQAYLKASNTGWHDQFGISAAVSGDTALVGAWVEKSSATGIDGDQSDNSAYGAGAAYVFTRSGTTWSQQAYLKASNTEAWDYFGRPVSLSGNAAVIGASMESSSSTGVDGNQGNGSGESGAAYLFSRQGDQWSQEAYLKASNTGAQDHFGSQVALCGDTVVSGAPREDSDASGVNGFQQDNDANAAGAAYVFDREAWADMGSTLSGGVYGGPLLVGTGSLADRSANGIALSYSVPDATCALFVATSSTPTPFKGGTLLPVPWLIGPLFDTTGTDGAVSLPFTMPAGLPPQSSLWFQYAVEDTAAVQGVSLSNAIVGTSP